MGGGEAMCWASWWPAAARALWGWTRHPRLKFWRACPPPPNRLSVSWPRVIPKGCATCPINAKGLKFYVDLVKELIANGIEPAVTL